MEIILDVKEMPIMISFSMHVYLLGGLGPYTADIGAADYKK